LVQGSLGCPHHRYHSLIHSFINSHPLIHSFINSLSLIHSFTHSLIHIHYHLLIHSILCSVLQGLSTAR
jgi:hypothetical protein